MNLFITISRLYNKNITVSTTFFCLYGIVVYLRDSKKMSLVASFNVFNIELIVLKYVLKKY